MSAYPVIYLSSIYPSIHSSIHMCVHVSIIVSVYTSIFLFSVGFMDFYFLHSVRQFGREIGLLQGLNLTRTSAIRINTHAASRI